ncbi:MAG: 2-amino-4-hydroxy-6-hydroxymethyldihydropteridine diphosphokinase [Planctomycetia bacterium]
MARCLIGCGSNLGRRREQLDRAIELMRFMPGVTVLGVSRFHETVPVGGPSGQGDFLNGACLVETDLPPRDVLSMLNAVENTLHRERDERWGPRTIDLDLLLYDDLVLDSADLTVPHPRMSTRRFVLEPCVEIAADARHPLAACTLHEMLDSICAPRPHVAVVGVPGSGGELLARAVGESTVGCLVNAPRPLPDREAAPAEWCETLDAWATTLTEIDCDESAHGVVADCWLEMLRLAAAESLDDDSRSRFEEHFARRAATVPVPHAILVRVAAPAVLDHDPHRMRLQSRLLAALRDPGYSSPLKPKAVVVIDAADPGRAATDAVAAVEAMV